jgi:hypothetical protein
MCAKTGSHRVRPIGKTRHRVSSDHVRYLDAARRVLRELPADSAQGLLMPLSLRDRLTMLMPPSVFYRQRIAQEARTGEPELAVLAELVPRGGIAVDVGANVGFFAYALADIADRVLAFEPNPDYAFFARWMLRGRAGR